MEKTEDITTIFVHIPKTAGTTLRSILEDSFLSDDLFFLYIGNANNQDMEDFNALSDEEKRRKKIYCGHFDYGFHKKIPKPCQYLTVMRDPIRRTISLYNHLIKEENAQHDESVEILQKRIRSENLDLEKFLLSGISLDTDNAQTRILSGDSPPFGQCNRETLEKAKKNLQEHFLLTGLTERFDESIILMHKLMNWPMPFYVKQNVASKHGGISSYSEKTIETIKYFSKLDTELYEFAEKLLDEQIEKQGPEFQKNIEEFKIANRYYAEWFGKIDSIRTIKKRIDALENSWSWKITAPIRQTVSIIQRIKRS